jgi:hypothetical protein
MAHDPDLIHFDRHQAISDEVMSFERFDHPAAQISY